MKWNEVTRKISKIGYKESNRKRHATIWNCPCQNKAHPISVINHPNQECHNSGLKKQLLKQLGPHAKDF